MKKTTKRPTIAELKREIQKFKQKLEVLETVHKFCPPVKVTSIPDQVAFAKRTNTRVLYGA